MSTYAIKTFHKDLERLKHYGGSNKETAIRFAFQKLLDEYVKSKDLMLIPDISLRKQCRSLSAHASAWSERAGEKKKTIN